MTANWYNSRRKLPREKGYVMEQADVMAENGMGNKTETCRFDGELEEIRKAVDVPTEQLD